MQLRDRRNRTIRGVPPNERNADIGAAVPPLHIASIGIEKMIPRVEDMGVFIRLLTRSALGELATQYASHSLAQEKAASFTSSWWTMAGAAAWVWPTSGIRSNVFTAARA